jgi:hypothetical protein
MARAELIEREMATAEQARKAGNEGKARVCARRAVAVATEDWLGRQPIRRWRGDAMAHLRHIQDDESFPAPVRQAAERLSTAVTKRDSVPFTSDPISDARLIIAHLSALTSESTPDHPS